MFDLKSIVRPNVLKTKPYSSARSEYVGTASILLDANESPFGEYNRYPDPSHGDVKYKLAQVKDITVDQIAIGNGSDELIDILMRIFCRPGIDKVLTFVPTYGMYKVCASINDVSIVQCPLNNSFQIETTELNDVLFNPLIRMIFICSPNNPTGNLINAEDIEFILKRTRGLVVLDEAYIDFANETSKISWLNKYSNLVVVQTMSKAWGLAGARIGVMYASKEIIDLVNKIKAPYNVSALNQSAALEALSKDGELAKSIKRIKKAKKYLTEELLKLDVVQHIFPSETNFLLVRFKNSKYVYQSLISNNIVVRDRSHLVENSLRISIGKSLENEKLLEVLKCISNE